MSFGENLIALRKARGISRKELADALEIPYTTLRNYETDAREPGHVFLVKLAQLLNVSVDSLVGAPEKQKSAPSLSNEALDVARRYDAAPDNIKGIVNAVLDLNNGADVTPTAAPKKTKVIPLFGARFAAGTPETAGDLEWENYETTNQKADFAIHVNGDSMEPVLQDGTIALGVRRFPQAGEVGAFRIDGEFLVKQFVQDSQGNVYLFSVNRDRSDADLVLWHDSDRDLQCYGTILCARTPLPD